MGLYLLCIRGQDRFIISQRKLCLRMTSKASLITLIEDKEKFYFDRMTLLHSDWILCCYFKCNVYTVLHWHLCKHLFICIIGNQQSTLFAQVSAVQYLINDKKWLRSIELFLAVQHVTFTRCITARLGPQFTGNVTFILYTCSQCITSNYIKFYNNP